MPPALPAIGTTMNLILIQSNYSHESNADVHHCPELLKPLVGQRKHVQHQLHQHGYFSKCCSAKVLSARTWICRCIAGLLARHWTATEHAFAEFQNLPMFICSLSSIGFYVSSYKITRRTARATRAPPGLPRAARGQLNRYIYVYKIEPTHERKANQILREMLELQQESKKST